MTEPLVSMKFPCGECDGTGRRRLDPPTAGWVECSTCGGHGLLPRDVSLSEFRKLLSE